MYNKKYFWIEMLTWSDSCTILLVVKSDYVFYFSDKEIYFFSFVIYLENHTFVLRKKVFFVAIYFRIFGFLSSKSILSFESFIKICSKIDVPQSFKNFLGFVPFLGIHTFFCCCCLGIYILFLKWQNEIF